MLNIFFIFIITSYLLNSFGLANRIQYVCTHNNFDFYKLVGNLSYKFPSNWFINQSIRAYCETPKYFAQCESNIFNYTYRKESSKYSEFKRLSWLLNIPKESGIFQSKYHEEIIAYDYLCVPNYIDTKSARRRNSRIKYASKTNLSN
jgi:hypothetical protein